MKEDKDKEEFTVCSYNTISYRVIQADGIISDIRNVFLIIPLKYMHFQHLQMPVFPPFCLLFVQFHPYHSRSKDRLLFH